LIFFIIIFVFLFLLLLSCKKLSLLVSSDSTVTYSVYGFLRALQVAQTVRRLMASKIKNAELEVMWEEAVMAYFELLYPHLCRGSEEDH
jgi:hypothetical protein